MGCDIHAFIEFREGDRWRPFGGELNIDRDYDLFGAMANVRTGGAVVPPRGIPEDMAYAADGRWWLYITEAREDYGCVSVETAEQYQRLGSRVRKDKDGKTRWVEHPDWHTPSWMTAEEFSSALEKSGHRGDVANAALAAMFYLDGQSSNSRIVFWFDN